MRSNILGLAEISLAIIVMVGVIAFGLIFYGLVHMADPPCQQEVSADGLIQNSWCAENPKWVLPAE
jgi:hypothetical protein